MSITTPVQNVAHDAETFVIGGHQIQCRVISDGDVFSNRNIKELITSEKLTVFCQPDSWPTESLSVISEHQSDSATIYVAVRNVINSDELLALGYTNLDTDIDVLNMGVVCNPRYTGTRLPLELCKSLIRDASRHGAEAIRGFARSDNVLMSKLAKDLGMSVRLADDDTRCVVYSLNIDRHPNRVKL